MPAGTRIRGNNTFGFTTDNPLTAGAGTFNSPGLATLPVVAGDHAVITLDPMRVFGEPEIVVVTVHTASATVATITRGQYGTVARSHPQGTLFVHAPIDEDVIEVLTSSTRPGNPYEGQFIFETDTNKFVGYGGVDWAPRDAGGQLGYAQIIAAQTTITANVDLTGLTATVTVATGRRIRISAEVGVGVSNVDTTARLLIQESITVLQRRDVRPAVVDSTSNLLGLNASVVLSPSAGSHTYKLTAERVAGTGNVQIGAASNHPAFILVEDIGAA